MNMKSMLFTVFIGWGGLVGHAQDPSSFQIHEPKTGLAKYLGLDMVELVGGTGEHTDHGRLALHWNVGTYEFLKKPFKLSLAGSYAIYELAAKNSRGAARLRDAGLTPTLLYHFGQRRWRLRPFLEAGIGFHYLTEKDITEKTFSTHFQFGDHISLGLEFGQRFDYRINYQFQHLSNAGIDDPNPGINFHLISFGARLR